MVCKMCWLYNIIIVVCYLLSVNISNVHGLNLPGTQPQVKVGRVSAGPITISQLGCGTWSW